MECSKIAEAVCRMASDFKRLRDRSMLDLVKSSGYVQNHDAVSESKLQEVFDANPYLIQTWLNYSADQRTSEGHYLLDSDIDGRPGWMVGHFPDGNDKRFADGPAACARFVKLEAEDLRRNALR